jgi:hypothetical protein
LHDRTTERSRDIGIKESTGKELVFPVVSLVEITG